MYDDLLDDPKVQRLDPVLFKTWVNLLCLASRNDGTLPGIEDIAFALRISDDDAASRMADLVAKGLIDDGEELTPHNWNARQFKSDRDESGAERQKRKRERDKGVTVTRDITDQVTEVSRPPETEQNRTDSEQSESRGARAQGHREISDAILKDAAFTLTSWEEGFLSNIAQLDRLTAEQKTQFKAVTDRWKGKQANAPPLKERFYAAAGSQALEAWDVHLRKKTGRSAPRDGKGGWWFDAPLPPTSDTERPAA